jgi:HD-like signal output (HDOD) protein
MDEKIIAKTEKLVQSIGIPSMPKIIMQIDEEVKKAEPDFEVITNLVVRDVAMSAKIIKVCNSPYFGLRHKVDSVGKALSILGLNNFKDVILASALRDTMNSRNIREKDFEYFCNHSFFIAKVAQTIALRVPKEIRKNLDPNHAYLAGLFHDCAIPMLTKKFNDYLKEVAEALKSKKSMVAIEEDFYQSNHCIAGYLVAKSWGLPENVCGAIQNHHNVDISAVDDLGTRRILAVLILAESIIYYKDNKMDDVFYVFNYNIGEENYDSLMFELDFAKDDLADIEEWVDGVLDVVAEV